MLYAAAAFMVMGLTVETPSVCRASWIGACVPIADGGECSANCAEEAVWDKTPDAFKSTGILVEVPYRTKLRPEACQIPLCSARDYSCGLASDREQCDLKDPKLGACECVYYLEELTFNFAFRTLCLLVILRVPYVPARLLMLRHFDSSEYCCVRALSMSINCFVGFMAIVLFGLGADILSDLKSPFAVVIGQWALWCLLFTMLDALKSFALGYILGYYFVRPMCCSCFWVIWRTVLG